MDALSLLPAVIRAVAPRADASMWAAAFEAPLRVSGITSPKRIAMALAMFGEESGFEMVATPRGLRLVEENLDYTAADICHAWGHRYPTPASVPASIVGHPQNLANTVYAGREGNGDFASGDGWRFRGRGPVQITFRHAYEAFAAAMKRPLDDDFLDWMSTPAGGSASACWFWLQPCRPPSLLALSDAGDVEGVTSRVNGGLGNLTTRVRFFNAALAVFGLTPEPAQHLTPAGETGASLASGHVTSPAESEADQLMDAEMRALGPAPPA